MLGYLGRFPLARLDDGPSSHDLVGEEGDSHDEEG